MPKSMNSFGLGLRYGSTVPVRFGLALAATIYAVLLLIAPDSLEARRMMSSLFAFGPRWEVGAWVFFDAMLLWWRLVDQHGRVLMGRIVNAATAGMWFGLVIATSQTLGYLPPDNTAEIVLGLAATWATVRTDMTVNDRETA